MNLATIGTGTIVDNFLSALSEVEHVSCKAIYSRTFESAQQLAEKHGVSKTYTNLEDMLHNPEIDFVYIASPNSLHFTHAYQALSSGKNVICEKPFTSTANELHRLICLAKKRSLFLFEAISTIYMPNYKLVKEHIPQLGKITFIQANYSQYSSRYDNLLQGETPNVFNPVFSGGALMDINLYNIHFVMNAFGKPDHLRYSANKHKNGIDTSGVLIMEYEGFISECVGCKDSSSLNFVLIQGDKGFIHVEGGANGCKKITLHQDGTSVELNHQPNRSHLFYEIQAFEHIFRTNDHEACEELMHYSHSVMEVLEAARKDANILFPADEND